MCWKSSDDKRNEYDRKHENELRDLNEKHHDSEKKRLMPEAHHPKKSSNCCVKFFKCICWTFVIILILLIILMIVLLVLYGAQMWAVYKGYKVAQGLYLTATSNSTSLVDVAKSVYSIT